MLMSCGPRQMPSTGKPLLTAASSSAISNASRSGTLLAGLLLSLVIVVEPGSALGERVDALVHLLAQAVGVQARRHVLAAREQHSVEVRHHVGRVGIERHMERDGPRSMNRLGVVRRCTDRLRRRRTRAGSLGCGRRRGAVPTIQSAAWAPGHPRWEVSNRLRDPRSTVRAGTVGPVVALCPNRLGVLGSDGAREALAHAC